MGPTGYIGWEHAGLHVISHKDPPVANCTYTRFCICTVHVFAPAHVFIECRTMDMKDGWALIPKNNGIWLVPLKQIVDFFKKKLYITKTGNTKPGQRILSTNAHRCQYQGLIVSGFHVSLPTLKRIVMIRKINLPLSEHFKK